MPHTIRLENGSDVIDLNAMVDGGFTTESFTLPTVQRQTSRVSGFPFASGSRTVASALQDSTAEWTGFVQSPSVDAMEASYQALVLLLEKAQAWEERREDRPVRLAFKRSGATNTAYWVVTGATPPEPASEPREMAATEAVMLRLRFTLILEPLAHADTLTSVITSATITNTMSSNMAVGSATLQGDMDGPLSLTVTNTSGVTLNEVWIAHLAATTQATDIGGTSDATARGGLYTPTIITATPSTVINASITPTVNTAYRVVVRVKVTSGIVPNVRLRAQLSVGGTLYTGAWVQMPNGSGINWQLIDLGPVQFPPHFLNRTSQTGATSTLSVAAKSTAASSITIGVDYVEALPYYSFTRLVGGISNTYRLHYEMVAVSNGFSWPIATPQTYVVDGSNILSSTPTRYGALLPIPPNVSQRFWVALIGTSGHVLTHTASLKVDYLATYALGLRGAD